MKHADVIQAFGGPRVVADGLGVPERRVRGWRDRDSIPSRYWPALIGLAVEKDVPVTYAGLARALSEAA